MWWILNDILLQISWWMCQWRNFENPSIFDEVTVCDPSCVYEKAVVSQGNRARCRCNFLRWRPAVFFNPGFSRTGNSDIRSANPENRTLEPNMKWIWSPVAEIWPFEVRQGCIRDPHFEGRGGRRGQRSYRWKEWCWFLIALNCDYCAISDHSAAICHRISAKLNSTGGGPLRARILGVPLEQTSDVWVCGERTPG